jgi:hypothetical protein
VSCSHGGFERKSHAHLPDEDSEDSGNQEQCDHGFFSNGLDDISL